MSTRKSSKKHLQNLKNDSHYLTITTWSGKDTIDPLMLIDEVQDNVVDIDDVLKAEVEKLVTRAESSQ